MYRTLLLLPLLLVALGTSARGERASSSRIALLTIHMSTPQSGWGLTERRLVRTDDGGRVWHTVPVPLPRVPNMLNVNVALAVHGIRRVWLVPPITIHQGPPRSLVLSTVDAGRHWHRSSPIRGSAGNISWITARTGYILTGEGAAAGSIPNDLYRTGDGGLSWTLVEYNHLMNQSPGSLGACGRMVSFADTKDGTSPGSCGPAPQVLVLDRTTDGGRRWHHQKLSLPLGAHPGFWMLGAPAFFGRDGAMPAVVGRPAFFDLYFTHDAGATWAPTTPVRAAHPMDWPDAFVLTPSRAWFWLDGILYVTTDGGQSWRRLARLPFASQPELDFLTPRIGFALGGVGRAGSVTGIMRETTDGGRTWRMLRPVLR